VLSSFNIASWKPAPLASLRFFMKLAMALLLWPSWAIEKVPSLLSRITSGMEGKTTAALSRSRWGATASTTFWARSSNEDQRGDEHIGFGHIGAEGGVVLRIAQLLNQVAAQVDGQALFCSLRLFGRLGEGRSGTGARAPRRPPASRPDPHCRRAMLVVRRTRRLAERTCVNIGAGVIEQYEEAYGLRCWGEASEAKA